ncbi:MAG: tRNA 4-thiouridine(8) synthase ThiI, partial [Candidatus Omnitrophota bacterium]
GEVLGERPMSQKRVSLDIIMKYSTLEGLLVRPLSAKLLAETLPEKEGVIQREELLDISGRSRKRQYALAKKYGINRFFAPAGGCLLTDPMFSRGVKDLMKNGALSAEEIKLLKHGRHFRLTPDTKVVVGRNEKENGALMELKKEGDMILMLTDLPGPSALLRGAIDGDNVKKTAAIVARYYTKGGDVELTVEGWTDDSDRISFNAVTMDEEELERLRV